MVIPQESAPANATASASANAPVGALLKGFGVIEQLSDGATSLGDVSRRMGLPKSSAYRLLTTLVELGVVERADNDDYRLTPRLFEYGIKALGSMDLVTLSRPFMHTLRDTTGETVHLAVRSGIHAVYLQKVNSSHALRMDSRIGYQAQLYNTSLGKVLLAWLDPEEAKKLANSIEYKPIMPNTLQTASALLEHLEEVRTKGYACDNEENEANVICFGAPVFDHYGQIMAAVSVSMPKLRFSTEKEAAIVHAVQEAGREISRKFGCTVWPPAVA